MDKKESIHGSRIPRAEALFGIISEEEAEETRKEFRAKPNPNWVTPPPPEGYFALRAGTNIRRGDLWLRPYDGCWIETGKAHWFCKVTWDGEFARRNNPEPPEVEYRYEAVHHYHSPRFDE